MGEATSTDELFAEDGANYRLSTLIAEGGEGRVFHLESRRDIVAKLYRERVDGQEAKLKHLISLRSDRLAKAGAWPMGVLRDSAGATIGFTMESLVGWEPLHAVYQVKSRLQLRPQMTWRHLVRVARNLASCVHHAHDAGLIIGDLNESNVFVSKDCMVKLIDVDSFQCEADGELFACRVGKAELLAPELQGLSLEAYTRTEAHDCFSLAVLIFETLMFGRHPFAGRPEDENDLSLEGAIARSWYAYTTNKTIPVAPPLGIEMDWLAPALREQFESAFDGNPESRPSAYDWYLGLKQFEDELTTCIHIPSHLYWKAIDDCPWCQLEIQRNLDLFKPLGSSTGLPNFAIERLWEVIDAVEPPEPVAPIAMVDASAFQPAQTLETWALKYRLLAFPLLLADTVLDGMTSLDTTLRVLILLPPVLLLLVWAKYEVQDKQPFVTKQKQLQGIIDLWHATASPAIFDSAKAQLWKAKILLQEPEKRLEAKRNKLIKNLCRNELDRYLARISVDSFVEASSFSGAEELLRTLGVRTAEQVRQNKLAAEGFNIEKDFAASIFKWRKQLELEFWANSDFRLHDSKEKGILAEVAAEDEDARNQLARGPQMLKMLKIDLAEAHLDLSEQAVPLIQDLQEMARIVAALPPPRN
jgi:DNA-binding helix-hairpin-helix protein with protein kinase domain